MDAAQPRHTPDGHPPSVATHSSTRSSVPPQQLEGREHVEAGHKLQLPATPQRRVTAEQVEKIRAAHQMTLGDVLEKFRDSPRANHDDREIRRINFLLRNFRELCDLNVYTCNDEDIAKFIDFRIEEASNRGYELGGNTINKDLSCINSAIRHAAMYEHARDLTTPILERHFSKPTEFCVERLDADAEAVLLDFATRYEQTNTVPLATIMTTMLGTGMRRTELASIREGDFDFHGSQVLLPKTKNGTARVVPLWPYLVELLSKLQPRSNGTLFPSASSISIAWHRMREKAAEAVERQGNLQLAATIRAVRLHDLRHEAISRFVSRLDWPDAKVMAIVGLKTPKMLSYYTKFRPHELVQQMVEAETQFTAPSYAKALAPVVAAPAPSGSKAGWDWIRNNPSAFQMLLDQHPKTAIASLFDISEAAVRKAASKLGLVGQRRGHWSRDTAH
jgi:integrase